MKRFRILLSIPAVLVVVTAIVVLMSPYVLRDATLSFSWGSKPRAMLKSMGVPDGAYDLSKISVSEQDGTMPEIAMRSFEVRGSSADALREFFATKCKEAGLSPPEAEELRVEPDLLCKASVPGVAESFHLSARCASDACSVTVEVQRLTH